MRLTVALLAAGLVAGPVMAAESPATAELALAPVKLDNLHYGDVLWRFFQDDYSGALVRLEAYRAQGLLDNRADEAELLSGGLYLSLGLHREAARVFERLLEKPGVPDATRSRAWFYLGKVQYARGYLPEAERAFTRAAGGSLPPELEAERGLLLAQSLMNRGQFDAAAALLRQWDGPSPWKAYGQFNLGVALVRSGNAAAGHALLEQLGTAPAVGEEALALRDKANLALGYSLLQAGQSASARAPLERVRLRGPQSNKALLGAGWADANEGMFKEALAPWLELQGRDLLDAAVQESYLAVPYAFARLDANRQAADYYEQAIAAYARESARLAESISAIRAGRLLDSVAAADRGGQEGWFSQLTQLPDVAESRYLYHLMAGNEFQEGLKNFRALSAMSRDLASWSESLLAFQDIVATRERAFAAKLPAAEQRFAAVDIEALDARRDALRARLDAALRDRDPVALASAGELSAWGRVAAVEEAMAAAGPDADLADAREKTRLARGVLLWSMSESYKLRAWEAKRDLRQLDAAMYDARTGLTAVAGARRSIPARNAALGARIAAMQPRLESMATRVAAAREAQGRFLADLAVRELESQRSRLAEYTLQARYALATLYDRATAPGGAAP